MSEIVNMDDLNVKIGLDDGKILTVPKASIAYDNPEIGDEVKIYKDGEQNYIKKVKTTPGTGQQYAGPAININNANTVQQIGIGGNLGVTRRINKALYLILIFFFGWLGIHRFMRGQVGIGILYLLTFGLLLWGPLIDFIIGLTKLNQYDGEFLFTRHGDWSE